MNGLENQSLELSIDWCHYLNGKSDKQIDALIHRSIHPPTQPVAGMKTMTKKWNDPTWTLNSLELQCYYATYIQLTKLQLNHKETYRHADVHRPHPESRGQYLEMLCHFLSPYHSVIITTTLVCITNDIIYYNKATSSAKTLWLKLSGFTIKSASSLTKFKAAPVQYCLQLMRHNALRILVLYKLMHLEF